MPLDAVGRDVTWGEAVGLVAELKRDPNSHLTASLEGWAWVPGPGEIALTSLLQSFLNVNRDPEKQAEPISLPFPWTEPATEDDDITPEQRAALIQSFNERSALRDL